MQWMDHDKKRYHGTRCPLRCDVEPINPLSDEADRRRLTPFLSLHPSILCLAAFPCFMLIEFAYVLFDESLCLFPVLCVAVLCPCDSNDVFQFNLQFRLS